MARASKDGVVQHDAKQRQTEQMLDRRNITYTFEANLPLDQLRDAEGNQVRLTEHRAPKERVEAYATAMAEGAVFPAIVVNDRHEIIDGNTRWGAKAKNGDATIAAYICHGVNPLDARSLSVELNQANGQRMDDEELRAFVVSCVSENREPNIQAFARMTGVSKQTLKRWVRVAQFAKRAAEEGIPQERTAKLSDAVQAKLNVAKLRSVFQGVVELAIDAELPAKEVGAVITAANAAASEEESLAVVNQAREDRSERISTLAAGFKTTKRKGQQTRMHVAGLLRFEVDELLDVDPERRPETFENLTTLRDRLNAALERAEEEWGMAAHELAEVQ
jgi:transposase-like protein